MFCKKCGNELPDDAQFCTRCGYSTNDNLNNNSNNNLNNNLNNNSNNNLNNNLNNNSNNNLNNNLNDNSNNNSNNNAQSISDNEEKFQKKLKGTKMFSILMSCIFGVLFVLSLVRQGYAAALYSLFIIITFMLFYNLTKRKIIVGPIIGIILGGSYIVSFINTRNVLSIILGIVVVVDSVSMLKYLKNNTN